MKKNRVIALNSANEKEGPVIYWMSRDQRINSNWSLIYAQLIAEKKREDFLKDEKDLGKLEGAD